MYVTDERIYEPKCRSLQCIMVVFPCIIFRPSSYISPHFLSNQCTFVLVSVDFYGIFLANGAAVVLIGLKTRLDVLCEGILDTKFRCVAHSVTKMCTKSLKMR